MQQQLLKFLVKNKKISITSIIIIALGGTIFFSGAFLPALELQNLEKLMLKYTTKIEAHMEQTASRKVFKLLACKGFGGGVGGAAFGCNKSNPEEEMTKAQNITEADAAAAAGEEMTSEIDKFNFNDPQITKTLSNQGIKVNSDATGQLTGFKDTSNGSSLTENDFSNNSSISTELNTALPESSVNLIDNVEPMLNSEDGVDFAGIDAPPTDTQSQVDNLIESDVQSGVIEQTATAATTDKNPTPTDQNNASANNTVENAVQATQDALNSGATETQALSAGVSKMSLGNSLLASSIATSVCSIYNAAAHGSGQRIVTITNLLMRHSGLIFSLADQMKVGSPTPTAVGSFMNILHAKNSSGQTYESSVSYRKMSGLPVYRNSPDISPSSLPIASSGTLLVNETTKIMNTMGGTFTCKILNSPFGGLFQGALGIVQLVTDIGSFGASQVAITAGLLAGNYEIQHTLIPDILKYFTVVGLSGIENGPSWVNNAFLGSVITSNRIAQSLGGQPMSTTAANSAAAVVGYDQAKQESSLPLTTRLFSIDNPSSLISRVIPYIPTSISGLFSDISNYFTDFFSTLFKNTADLLMPSKIFAATNYQSPGASYGVTTYGLSDSQATKYPIIQNENYLYGSDNLTLPDGSVLSLKRITLTGNPYSYPNGAADNSATDLYHCFSQSFASQSSSSSTIPLNFSSGNNDPICGSMGSLDSANDPPHPIGENEVLYAYCHTFAATFVSDTLTEDECVKQLTPQYSDDIGHFSQYILDSAVVHNYYSMMSTQ